MWAIRNIKLSIPSTLIIWFLKNYATNIKKFLKYAVHLI